MKKFNYGLMVINPAHKDDEFIHVLHFVGYWNAPTVNDRNHLYDELKTDTEFGLTELIDELEILPAPKDVVEEYWKEVEICEENKLRDGISIHKENEL
jgi:hypothetical protein